MTYIFVDFEGYKYWIEVHDQGFALRQVTIDEKEKLSISCLENCLTDQFVDIENDCEVITKQEFEKIWEGATFTWRKIWNVEKLNYKMGQKVSGKVKYFYPQGAILDLINVTGCADITWCNNGPLNSNDTVNGIVACYDEENMWILIDKC